MNLSELYSQIEQLISSGKFHEAYALCVKILKTDSENETVFNYKNRIEKIILERNKAIIDADIDKLKPLWKEGKFLEIIEKLEILKNYAPTYERLSELIFDAKNRQNEKIIRERNEAILKQLKAFKEKIKFEDFWHAFLLSEQIGGIKNLPHRFSTKLNRLRKKMISKYLKSKAALLNSNQDKEVYQFLQKLLSVSPENKKLRRKIEQFQEEYFESQNEKLNEFIFENTEDLKVQMQKSNYDIAKKIAEKILSTQPKNSFANKTLKLCESKIQKLAQSEISEKIQKDFEEDKNRAKKYPHNFIKI
jgi:hypothetical protein